MSNQHPTFPNPIIHEALCEIHFALPEGFDWDPAIYGRFFALVQQDFPLIEPVAGPQIRMRYRHHTRPLLLQLSENILSVNLLPKYPGWQQMKSDIVGVWSWLREIVGPLEVTRVGIRYINFIPVTNEDERMVDWLAPNPYVANAVLHSRPSSNRSEISVDDHTKAVVVVGDIANVENIRDRKFVIDIDAIARMDGTHTSKLADAIEVLHDDVVWPIFDGFRTPRLNQLLNQEDP